MKKIFYNLWLWLGVFAEWILSFEPATPMLVAFQISFWITRHVRVNATSWVVKDVAVHHFLWAFGILAIITILREYYHGPRSRALFRCVGPGLLGIILDEFGMMLHLKPDDGGSMKGYWIFTGTMLVIIIVRLFYKAVRNSDISKDELKFWSSNKDDPG